MRAIQRKTLKTTLSKLAKLAVKKHGIELILITGTYRPRATKELMYAVLSEHFKVRRNIKKIWWDLSLPLNILGYKDKERSTIQWVIIIFKAIFVLALGPKNKHKLIIDIDNRVEDIEEYWSNLLMPKYFVLLDTQRETNFITQILKHAESHKTNLVMPKSEWAEQLAKKYKVLTYGEGCKLEVIDKETEIDVMYKKKREVYKKREGINYSWKTIGAVYQVALAEGLEMNKIFVDSLKFELPFDLVSKLKTKLIGA